VDGGSFLRSTLLAAAIVAAPASADAAAEDLRLVEAARNRDRDAVRALVKQGLDVNAPQPDGATALHWAIHWDDLETANLLLRAGARVNAANDYGVTPLWLACTNANAAMVDALLAAGANPNTTLGTGETVLMTAARTGRLAIVQALLTAGAAIDAREHVRGQTALMWATAEGHTEIISALLARGADVRARSIAGFTPLMFAARVGDVAASRILLGAGADIDAAAPNGPTSLLIATIRGHTGYGVFLLERGANPNLGPGFTPLHWAAGAWPTELTGGTAGIIPDDTEWSPLGGLRGQAKLDFVKALLTHGADPNARAVTNPRYTAVGGRGTANVGTPFYMAAKAGDAGVMRLLVASGADPRVATDLDTTPLMAAAGVGASSESRVTESEALEAVKLALELGGDVHAINADGETALHGAAYTGRNSIVQMLVDRGAQLNVKNQYGWTPLTIAEGVFEGPNEAGTPKTAELLRRLGADPSPPDIERNPLRFKAVF
jgi:ankyrin repeat protein